MAVKWRDILYIEFECRVQNITFVEKYMSVSASGGTGRVATNVKKKTEDKPTVINKDDLHAVPMAKEVKMTDKGGGVVVSGGVEEGELYDVVELTYKTKTDSIP